MYIHTGAIVNITIASIALPSRVFMNGNSQAVRIPQEFRLDAQRVEISRTPDGDLLIHPVSENRGVALLRALQGFDDDMVAALEAAHQESVAQLMQDRESI